MSGIYLYTGNRLEILADKLAELLDSSPLPPLEKEIILIQSRGMARWLALETASHLKIWANCECPFPNTFIRNIYKLLIPDLSDSSPYDKESITWHLMDIIPELLKTPHFKKVQYYLESDDGLKLYQLAHEIADLFDQYTIFRADMVLGWEAETNSPSSEHKWQHLLWSHLIERLKAKNNLFEFHRARLLNSFKERILDPGIDKRLLPSRISVFGISSLPPYHLTVLSALARHIDLHIFVMNPCMEFWFDIIADRDIVKISRETASSQNILHLEHGNNLLSSMGHLGRDFMAMVQEFESEDQEFFQDPGSKNLLSCIQQDILFLRGNPVPSHHSSIVKKKIKNNDASITFQSCHSPMREVEILHDQLLGFFDQFAENDPIEPRDILVMAPDINDYAPLIRAVFDAGNLTDNRLPYSISDQSIKKTSKYIDAFFEILSLLKGRFNSIDVFGLLRTEPVKNRFAINDHELSILEKWIDQTRICWGIDDNHKKNINLPDYIENTWRAGLDRLLLGYATPGEDNVLFKNILPYDNIEGNDTKLLGKFLDYTENLFAMAEILPQKHTLADWSEILLLLKDTYLLADDSSEADDRLLHQSLYGLRDLQTQTSFNTLISIDVMQSYLLDSLERRYSTIAGGAGFLSGGITFCSMLPMRAVPFKIICMLGLNDGLYPRSGHRRSFDLMALEPRRGDRSRRYDDRYLFLETILSARKKLYISFAGQSIQDGSKKPPSVLVSELMDYIEQGYEIDHRNDSSDDIINHLTTFHRLQPFHPEYFLSLDMSVKGKFFSYSAENCDAAVAYTIKPQNKYPLVTSPLSTPPETYRHVELNELIRFFTHPVRYFLVMRIGIAPIEESQSLNTSEPFAVKGLERYKLENDILKRLMEGHDCDNFYQVKKAESTLPHGKMGEIHFTQIKSAVLSFKRTLDALFSQKEPQHQKFSITINNFKINGRLDNLSEKGMVHYRYATINPKDMIHGWINHLALNSINGKPGTAKNTFLAGKDKILEYLPVPGNSTYLEQLLSLYWQGLSEPLHFFPRSSFVFAREIYKGNSEQEAQIKAKSEWEGNAFNAIAEKNDPYNSLCFKNIDMTDTLFMDQAKKLFLPIFEYQTRHKVF